MEMESVARSVAEGLRHERRRHAALFGQHADEVAQRDDAVGRHERLVVREVLLELPGSILVVVGVVAPAEGVHGVADRGQVVVHASDATRVVAGTESFVLRIGGGEAAMLVPVDEEVLDLGPDLRAESALGQPGEGALQDDAGGVRPRLAVDVRVAVDDREPFADEGDGCVGVEVGHGDEVGVVRLLPDEAGGESREAEFACFEFVGRRNRHEFRAGLAVEVDEHGEDEADVVGQRAIAQRLWSGGECDDVTSGECGKGHSGSPQAVDCW